jgi:hypothetical protein
LKHLATTRRFQERLRGLSSSHKRGTSRAPWNAWRREALTSSSPLVRPRLRSALALTTLPSPLGAPSAPSPRAATPSRAPSPTSSTSAGPGNSMPSGEAQPPGPSLIPPPCPSPDVPWDSSESPLPLFFALTFRRQALFNQRLALDRAMLSALVLLRGSARYTLLLHQTVVVSLDRRGRVPQAGEGGRAKQITRKLEN